MISKLKEKYQINDDIHTLYLQKTTEDLINLGISLTHNLTPLKVAQSREDFKCAFEQIINESIIERITKSVHANPVENVQWIIHYAKEFNVVLDIEKKIDLMFKIKDYRAKLFLFENIQENLNQNVEKEIDYFPIIKNACLSDDKFINVDLLYELPQFNTVMKYGNVAKNEPNALLTALMFADSSEDHATLIKQIKSLDITIESNQILNLENFINIVINNTTIDNFPYRAIRLVAEIKEDKLFKSAYEYLKESQITYNITLNEQSDKEMLELEKKYLEATISNVNENSRKIKI